MYTTEEDIFEDASDRSDGLHVISFGHIRNTALDHVRYSDDDGPRTNFRFDLDPGECYQLLVDGYAPTTSGRYGLEVTGTRRVGHNAVSSDGRRMEWSFHFHGDVPTGIVTGARAYLVQAVQTIEASVPLVAGREALLRVFPIAGRSTDYAIPAVRARFYRDGREIHVEDVPTSGFEPIPTEVDESSLAKSFNARIPGHVVQPGLEVAIEIDVAETRILQTGRLAVDVLDMPPFDLTLIPFLWTQSNDRSVIDQTRAMAARPESHELLADVRALLPVGRLRVTSLNPVWVESNRTLRGLARVEVIRTARGGTGHYMGLMGSYNGAGRALEPGWSSVSGLDANTIAHELGHNLNLGHAPCGDPASVDPAFPYRGGMIGAWGYDFARGRPVSPRTHDLMSYCYPQWISPYQFTKALRHRLGGHRFAAEGATQGATVAERAESLLLWGGTDAQGTPYLEPAFVIDAPPKLPLAEGDYRLTGRTAAGAELFSLTFGMPEVADGDGGSVFAFALPVRPEWEEGLASLTLSGPGGSTTIDDDSDLPMTILRDPGSGQIRAFLQGDRRRESLAQAFAPDPGVAVDPDLEVLFSRGIPDGAAWSR